MAYATGKYAIAQCDRCSFEYPLNQLKKEWNGLKTCPECWEPKHPQLEPLPHVMDPEALYEPRPIQIKKWERVLLLLFIQTFMNNII